MKNFTFVAAIALLFAAVQVNAQANLLEKLNPGFEGFSDTDPAYYWFTQVTGGAAGAIGFTTINPKEGARCLRAEITTKGVNPWEAQVFHTEYQTISALNAAGKPQEYLLRFWAKAGEDGHKFAAMVQAGAPTYSTPFSIMVEPTTSWKQFSYKFSIPTSDLLHPVYHFGADPATYFVDFVELGKAEDFVGANDLAEVQNVTVYPNPTTGLFELKNIETYESVDIMDLNGRLVRHFNAEGAPRFDVSDLANGVYQIAVHSKGIIGISKLVKL